MPTGWSPFTRLAGRALMWLRRCTIGPRPSSRHLCTWRCGSRARDLAATRQRWPRVCALPPRSRRTTPWESPSSSSTHSTSKSTGKGASFWYTGYCISVTISPYPLFQTFAFISWFVVVWHRGVSLLILMVSGNVVGHCLPLKNWRSPISLSVFFLDISNSEPKWNWQLLLLYWWKTVYPLKNQISSPNKYFKQGCNKEILGLGPFLSQQSSNFLHPFFPQFSWRLWRQQKQRHLLQRTVLHQLPCSHLDTVLDHRTSRLPGLQVHRRMQAAQTQLRLWGEAVHSSRERPITHHVPGKEGGLHWDRSGWIPQYDCREVCLHDGQCLHSMKSWKQL